MTRRKPTPAQKSFHQGCVGTEKQGKRIARGQAESKPGEYEPAIGSPEARRKIEDRNESREPNQTEWYGL